MKRWICLLAILALAACQRAPERLWSGYVEGDYVYVASPLGGALTTLAVKRGETVARGAPLFALDSASERAAREEAQARAASAQAPRQEEVAVTQAQLVQARAQAALAASELERAQQLVTQGFISPSRLDDARTAARQSQAHVAELHVAGRDAAALDAAIAPWRSTPGLTWQRTDANLEDVFISLLADAPDNFKQAVA